MALLPYCLTDFFLRCIQTVNVYLWLKRLRGTCLHVKSGDVSIDRLAVCFRINIVQRRSQPLQLPCSCLCFVVWACQIFQKCPVQVYIHWVLLAVGPLDHEPIVHRLKCCTLKVQRLGYLCWQNAFKGCVCNAAAVSLTVGLKFHSLLFEASRNLDMKYSSISIHDHASLR